MNKTGMTLIEVLIAATLLVIVSLGVGQLVRQMTISQQRAFQTWNANDLKALVDATLANTNACTKTISGPVSFSGLTPVTEIKDQNGTPIFTAGTTFGTPGSKVALISFNLEKVPGGAATGFNPGEAIQFYLNIKYCRSETVTASCPQSIVRVLLNLMPVLTTPPNSASATIGNCNADQAQYMSAMCETGFGGKWNDATQRCDTIKFKNAAGTEVITINTDNTAGAVPRIETVGIPIQAIKGTAPSLTTLAMDAANERIRTSKGTTTLDMDALNNRIQAAGGSGAAATTLAMDVATGAIKAVKGGNNLSMDATAGAIKALRGVNDLSMDATTGAIKAKAGPYESSMNFNTIRTSYLANSVTISASPLGGLVTASGRIKGQQMCAAGVDCVTNFRRFICPGNQMVIGFNGNGIVCGTKW